MSDDPVPPYLSTLLQRNTSIELLRGILAALGLLMVAAPGLRGQGTQESMTCVVIHGSRRSPSSPAATRSRSVEVPSAPATVPGPYAAHVHARTQEGQPLVVELQGTLADPVTNTRR